ncbi:MAG: DUF1963 domain-containing protein [Ruminococcus sp.]|nr:DUF1963 domain-containing protein [Ruminococcus sp.]
MTDYTFEDIEGFYRKKYDELLGSNDTDKAILFNEEECEDIPVGATKMGGLPDLPPEGEYPVMGEYTAGGKTIPAVKLPLICQINCEEIAPYLPDYSSLPKKGMVYIFWEGGDPDYYKKKYGVSTMKAYYWCGDRSTLVRTAADEKTKLNKETKVTFSECEESYVGYSEGDIEDILEDFENEASDYDVDYTETETYKLLNALKDESGYVSGQTKLYGFKAGLVRQDEYGGNPFLMLNVHEGALWYAYIWIHGFDRIEEKSGWFELGTGVDYDAD